MPVDQMSVAHFVLVGLVYQRKSRLEAVAPSSVNNDAQNRVFPLCLELAEALRAPRAITVSQPHNIDAKRRTFTAASDTSIPLSIPAGSTVSARLDDVEASNPKDARTKGDHTRSIPAKHSQGAFTIKTHMIGPKIQSEQQILITLHLRPPSHANDTKTTPPQRRYH